MTCFLIENNQVARLQTDDLFVRNLVAKGLTFKLPSYKFTKAHKTGGWDGSISFFKRNSNTFEAGLIEMAQEKATEIGLKIPVIDNRKHIPVTLGDDASINAAIEGKTLRDYQIAAIRAIFTKTRGIIQAPTGSGKTVIAAGAVRLANAAGCKVLFLTHQKELLYQTQRAFKSAGIDVGICGDSERDLDHATVIGMVQTLYAGMEKRKLNPKTKAWEITRAANPEIIALMKRTDFLVIDEAHRGDSQSFQAVCNHCTNAYYRIGLTATPLMKGLFEDIALISQTGGIIYRITIKDLVKQNLLAQPYVRFVKIDEPVLNQKLPYATAYKKGVVENTQRNDIIVNEALNFAAAGLTTLVLVSKISHGKTLLAGINHIAGKNVKVQFIHGSKDTETRAEALKALADKKLDVLISSVITDEGVDIPAVSAVILAGGLKSPIKLYQRVGRGMRPKADGNWVLILDFIDLTNKHLARHSKERYMLIRDEPGFIIVQGFDSLIHRKAA